MTQLPPADPRRVIVVGGGPAAHRLVDAIQSRDSAGELHVTVVAEEPHLPYDRVALSKRLAGEEDLTLQPSSVWDDDRIELRTGERAIRIDPHARTVMTDTGAVLAYDELVLATGSSAPVPDIDRKSVV